MAPEFNQLVDGRHGRFLVNRNDVFVGRSIIKTGEYSEGEVSALLERASPDATVVEVGANMGVVTVPLAKRAARVIAFEPQRLMFQTLCANLALNNLTNVEAWPMAVSNRSGTLEIETPDPHEPNNFGAAGIGRGETVPVSTLDILLSDEPRVDLIKIDVEGHEPQVLSGGASVIERCRPVIYMEADRDEHVDGLREALLAHRYGIWLHKPPLWSAVNFFRAPNPWGGNMISVNWLCVPLEREQPQGYERVG